MGRINNPNALINNIRELPTLLGSNLQFLKEWETANEETFEMVMAKLAEEKPEKWVDIYMKVHQAIAPVKENKTQTNISIKVDKDFDKLQALAGGAFGSAPQLESEGLKTTYSDYEEIRMS